MIITYQFADGKKTEVEVSEELGAVIIDMDRQDYNNDHKETRRHCSLEAYNLDDALIPSDEDVVGDFIKSEENHRLYAAIEKLKPRHRHLVIEVYFKGRKLCDVAEELGIAHNTASECLKRAEKNLKKLF